MMKKEELERWRDIHPTVKMWLSRLAPATTKNYLQAAHDFFEWIKTQLGYEGKEPEELLELQDKTQGRDRFNQLTMLQTWVQQQSGRLGTKKLLYTAVRSYYAHNRVPFPKDVTFRMRGDKPPVHSELTVDDLRDIILSSNPTYQAVYLIMFQGAMGSAEFEYFNTQSWPEVEAQLERGAKRIKIRLPGRKHSRNRLGYYTFIGKDAVDALNTYLKTKRGPIRNGEPIFISKRGDPLKRATLARYFNSRAVRVGAIKKWTPPCPKCGGTTRYTRPWQNQKLTVTYVCNDCGEETPASDIEVPKDIRYKTHPHEMRDLFRSEWDLSQAKGVAAEFFMGHDIDPNEYNKIMKLHPDWAEKQYSLAEPYLNIMSEDPRSIGVDRLEELIEKRARQLVQKDLPRLIREELEKMQREEA